MFILGCIPVPLSLDGEIDKHPYLNERTIIVSLLVGLGLGYTQIQMYSIILRIQYILIFQGVLFET